MTDDNDLICPITLELFRDPVLAKDGHVYEREAITHWIQQHGTSPFTREILHIEDLCDEDHLRQLAAQRRRSSTTSIKTIKIRSTATVCPRESFTLEQTIIRRSDCEKKSWVAIFLMLIITTGILCVTLLLIIVVKISSGKKIPSCISSTSQVTTLLQLTNVTQFNYTLFSYSYRAKSSNDTIVFSFRHNSSYWCLDDLSIINNNSKARLNGNGGFENGVLKPFRFCSENNYQPSNLLRQNINQRSGSYAFCYRPTFYTDYLTQNLNTTKGQIYQISFWIQNRSGPINKLQVSMIV